MTKTSDFNEMLEFEVVPKKRAMKAICINFPPKMLAELKELAIKRGCISYQQIIRAYVAEGIKRDETQK